MPPRKKKKNDKDDGKTDAQRAAVLETDEEILRERQVSTKIYQSALSSRIVSSALPSTAEVIQTRKNQLFKSDAKDIAKKANTRKSRHMVVFPGQFAQISFMNNNASGGGNGGGDNNNTTSAATNANAVEFGELADLDTQNPVCYINFPNGIGKMKLYGTIARARESRYFTLNLGSGGGGSSRKDSGANANANLEDFFDGVLIFSQWAWIGTKEENPEEKPLLEIPESVWKTMNSGNKKTAIDWERKNNSTSGKKKGGGKKGDENDDANTDAADDSVITLGDSDEEEGEGGGKDNKSKDAAGGRRPKRQAAAKAEKNLADNDGLGNIDFDGDDDSDSDDGHMTSPQALVRGKATISIISPIQPSIAGREVSLRSPGGGGSGNAKKKSSTDKAAAAAAAKKKAQHQKKKKREERIELSDADDSDDVMDLISSDESSEDDEPIAKKARPARRSSAAATKYKEDSDSDDDDDADEDGESEEEEEEEEESDFDDDSDFE